MYSLLFKRRPARTERVRSGGVREDLEISEIPPSLPFKKGGANSIS